MADIEPVATLPAANIRHPYIAANEKHEGVVSHAKDVFTRRNITRVEHAQINEAIAHGIAENVDDFMVQHTNMSNFRVEADGQRHSSKKQTKPTNESEG